MMFYGARTRIVVAADEVLPVVSVTVAVALAVPTLKFPDPYKVVVTWRLMPSHVTGVGMAVLSAVSPSPFPD